MNIVLEPKSRFNEIRIFNFIFITIKFFFFLMATPVAYGSSWARDQIQATTADLCCSCTMLDPVNHCAGQGMEHTSP